MVFRNRGDAAWTALLQKFTASSDALLTAEVAITRAERARLRGTGPGPSSELLQEAATLRSINDMRLEALLQFARQYRGVCEAAAPAPG
jgi:hypothetical protein